MTDYFKQQAMSGWQHDRFGMPLGGTCACGLCNPFAAGYGQIGAQQQALMHSQYSAQLQALMQPSPPTKRELAQEYAAAVRARRPEMQVRRIAK